MSEAYWQAGCPTACKLSPFDVLFMNDLLFFGGLGEGGGGGGGAGACPGPVFASEKGGRKSGLAIPESC